MPLLFPTAPFGCQTVSPLRLRQDHLTASCLWALIRCEAICVRRGRQTPSTILAVETARRSHNALCSPKGAVIVWASNRPASALALRLASSCMEPRTWKLPAKIKNPGCELHPSPAGVVKCAVHGDRQHARDKRERERREKHPGRDFSHLAAHQAVVSEGGRRRRKVHEDKQGRDGPHEPGGSDRVEKFDKPSQGVSKVVPSMCQIYRGLRKGDSRIAAASRRPGRPGGFSLRLARPRSLRTAGFGDDSGPAVMA